jgi:hypothetical protein
MPPGDRLSKMCEMIGIYYISAHLHVLYELNIAIVARNQSCYMKYKVLLVAHGAGAKECFFVFCAS